MKPSTPVITSLIFSLSKFFTACLCLSMLLAFSNQSFAQAAYPVLPSDSSAWQVVVHPSFGTSQTFPVTGQSFPEATRIHVTKLPGKFWDVQFRAVSTVAVPAETELKLTFHARSAEPAGQLAVKVEKTGAEMFFTHEGYVLTPEWQKFELKGIAKTDVFPGQLRVMFMAGQKLQTVEIGGVSLLAIPVPLSAAASAPVVPPEGMDAYNQWLRKDLQNEFKIDSAPFFAPSEEAMNALVWMGGPSIAGATKTIIDVSDAPFTKAIAFDVIKPKGENWHIMGGIWNPLPFVKGRSYLLTFYARGRVPGIGGMNVVADVAVRDMKSGKFWVQAGVSVGDSWQRYFVPFAARVDAPVKTVQFPIVIGQQVQQIEFGGLTVLDCGPTPLNKLPGDQAAAMDYPERKQDAPWRQEAEARIEKIRKADLSVQVLDAQGKPIPDATVKVSMTRHAFGWGTAIVPTYTMVSDKPLPTLERQNLPKYFNHIAIDGNLKLLDWVKYTPEKKAEVIAQLANLKQQGYTLNNGVIVWPGFRTNPSWLPLRESPEQLKSAVDEFITEIATRTEPYIDEVVVVNEPYSDREIARIFGEEKAFTHWYRLVRKLQPKAKLMLNEAGLTSNHGGLDIPRQDFIFNLSKMLIDQGLLDAIGDQAHYNVPTPLSRIAAVWDRLATLGKPLQVTEYDLSFGGDAQLEADYTRDFTTLAFAHPAMEAFTMWGFIDELHWKKSAPLFSAKDQRTLVMKPSGKAWIDLVYGKWWTQVQGTTDASGRYGTRGFLGDYDITVSANGKTQTVPAKLLKTGTNLTVTFK